MPCEMTTCVQCRKSYFGVGQIIRILVQHWFSTGNVYLKSQLGSPGVQQLMNEVQSQKEKKR